MKKNDRKSSTIKFEEALKDFLSQNHIEDKYEAVEIVAAWPKLLGETIAKKTVESFVKDKKLYVRISSAPLKHQLFTSKNRIIEIYHEHFQKPIIQDVVFL